jgi:predicted DNA binding protein
VSERQREALAAAWDAGYYAVPREGDIEAVAAELDCATSTASDLLRRAERQIVAASLDERS